MTRPRLDLDAIAAAVAEAADGADVADVYRSRRKAVALAGLARELVDELARAQRIVAAAEAFRAAAVLPEHRQFSSPPWGPMADLCAAVDGKTVSAPTASAGVLPLTEEEIAYADALAAPIGGRGTGKPFHFVGLLTATDSACGLALADGGRLPERLFTRASVLHSANWCADPVCVEQFKRARAAEARIYEVYGSGDGWASYTPHGAVAHAVQLGRARGMRQAWCGTNPVSARFVPSTMVEPHRRCKGVPCARRFLRDDQARAEVAR